MKDNKTLYSKYEFFDSECWKFEYSAVTDSVYLKLNYMREKIDSILSERDSNNYIFQWKTFEFYGVSHFGRKFHSIVNEKNANRFDYSDPCSKLVTVDNIRIREINKDSFSVRISFSSPFGNVNFNCSKLFFHEVNI